MKSSNSSETSLNSDSSKLESPPTVTSQLQPKKDSWWLLIDPLLIVSTVAILTLGLLLVYSATRGDVGEFDIADRSFLYRQALFIVAGIGLAALAAFIKPVHLRQFWYLLYFLTVALLGLVLVLGVEVNGTRGWFTLGGFSFQPSEPTKLILITGLALLKSPVGRQNKMVVGKMLKGLGVAIIPVVLVLMQPDLGTALVYLVVVFAVVTVSGVHARWVLILALLAILSMVVVFTSDILEDYQQARLTVFLFDTDEVPEAAATYAYNAEQAQIAIGNGGLLGQGLFKGTQTRSSLVPAQQTDFIFTVAGEELGLRGAGALLGLYALLLFRIWRTASLASSFFDRLICTGVFAMFSFQMFQAVGMTMGMMPVTGIPMPLVSYGGSSMLTSMVSLGLVVNVYRRRYQPPD